MKQINKIIQEITEAIDNGKLSYDDYQLLLQMSGILENDVSDFFVRTEDGLNGSIVDMSKSTLKKRLVLDKLFLESITANLPNFSLLADEVKNKPKIIGDNLVEIKSILIVTKNQGAKSNNELWIVFNNDFNNVVNFSLKGKQSNDSYIKTLFDIVYKGDGQVDYDFQILTSINSKIFKKKGVKEKYKQTTLVQKDGNKFKKNNKIEMKFTSVSALKGEQQKFFPKC